MGLLRQTLHKLPISHGLFYFSADSDKIIFHKHNTTQNNDMSKFLNNEHGRHSRHLFLVNISVLHVIHNLLCTRA